MFILAKTLAYSCNKGEIAYLFKKKGLQALFIYKVTSHTTSGVLGLNCVCTLDKEAERTSIQFLSIHRIN